MRKYLERISITGHFFSAGLTNICFIHSGHWAKKNYSFTFLRKISKDSTVSTMWGVKKINNNCNAARSFFILVLPLTVNEATFNSDEACLRPVRSTSIPALPDVFEVAFMWVTAAWCALIL